MYGSPSQQTAITKYVAELCSSLATAYTCVRKKQTGTTEGPLQPESPWSTVSTGGLSAVALPGGSTWPG